MRRCGTLRFKPLGRDRYYNRYYFFDQVGGGIGHGTGRLYVQGPSDGDMLVMRERGLRRSRVLGEDGEELYDEDLEEDEADRGKGWAEIWERMRADGLEGEAEAVEKWWQEREKRKEREQSKGRELVERMERMEVDGEEGFARKEGETVWWKYYSEPEQVSGCILCYSFFECVRFANDFSPTLYSCQCRSTNYRHG